jgi:Flp pilus assembly protein TadG
MLIKLFFSIGKNAPKKPLIAFAKDRSGNFGLMMALLTIPMVIALGVSVDYVRAYNTKARMQADLDSALIASVKDIDDLSTSAIKTRVENWFAGQTELDSSKYSLSDTNITVNQSNRTISAIVTGTVATTFMGIAGINSINVSVVSAVSGPATSFLNVYIVLDKSPSMLLAATTSDQTILRADANIACEFACHDTSDPVYKSGTTTVLATNYYNYIKSTYGSKLRADVSVTAAEKVLDMIDASNASSSHIKVGLYKLGATTTEVLAPTASTTTARTDLTTDSYGLTSSTSESATYFDKSLTALQTLVGSAGDGSSASKPLKLVLLLTDGVQSERNWVLYWNKPTYDVLGWKTSQSTSTKENIWKVITPLNPSWCSGIKTNGATMAILYTEYLPITADWGYNATLGQTMSSSYFSHTWGGTMRTDVSSSTTRLKYIPYALKDCATSEDLFISASDSDEIESGLSSLFNQYLYSVRLTQ